MFHMLLPVVDLWTAGRRVVLKLMEKLSFKISQMGISSLYNDGQCSRLLNCYLIDNWIIDIIRVFVVICSIDFSSIACQLTILA